MKDIIKEIKSQEKLSKEYLKNKNEELMKEILEYKANLEQANNEENEEVSLFEYDDDNGYKFDYSKVSDEDKEIVEDIFNKDPIFALNFLERKKEHIDEKEYNSLKSKLMKKVDIN